MHEEPGDNIILRVENLKKHFPVRSGFFRSVTDVVKAVDGVSLEIPRGKTLGLVGESGSGKTTVGRCILRAVEPTSGTISFQHNGELNNIADLNRKDLKNARRHLQMVFQDPFSSLNPRMPVIDLISEPLRAYGWPVGKRRERVHELMELVGLDPRYMSRYPHAFSGGQRQRIGIARALALSPSLIVADEPVSALDVSVQAQILNLMGDLQKKLGLTYLFVAHDLGVVRYICDRVAVMFKGRIVEVGDAEELFQHPRHPYTRALIEAAPIPDPEAPWLAGSEAFESGEPGESGESFKEESDPETGCPYAPRCPMALASCRRKTPPLEPVKGEPNRLSACFRVEEMIKTEDR
ncbi:MAG: ABC transporter ATP-binding protein [Verrucomicrobia bacterium]|nr:ABC transporter ATP-binding protein [Verrucomicrobiota bacterium]